MKFEAVMFGSDDKLQTILPGLLHMYIYVHICIYIYKNSKGK